MSSYQLEAAALQIESECVLKTLNGRWSLTH
ncbi:MAG: hypothetical protein RLZZ215_3367 [Pseudomonadota bacterium]|jgi:hypothetical protein